MKVNVLPNSSGVILRRNNTGLTLRKNWVRSIRVRTATTNVQYHPESSNYTKAKGNSGLKYAAVSLFFILILVAGAIYNNSDNIGKIPYQIVLYLVCSAPFFLNGNNPNHRLLAIFMASYYMNFGLANYIEIFFGIHTDFVLSGKLVFKSVGDKLSRSDLVVIVGSLAFLVGYLLIYKMYGKHISQRFIREWKPAILFNLSVVLCAIGLIFSIAYNMIVTPMYIPTHVLGIPLGIASNLRMLTPVSALMLIYLALRGEYRPKLIWILLTAIIAIEFVLGFIANSKEISFQIIALLILGMFYMSGRVNKKLIVTVMILTIPYMLFFNAYRNHVLMGNVRNVTQLQAFENIGKTIDKILKSTSKSKGVANSSLSRLASRVNGKTYINIIVEGTDSGRVPYQYGKTLFLFFETFIPRMFWADKPNNSIGQLFNHEFHLSASKYTFVPTTQLGEMYWNFGMGGVIVGMMGIGIIFGYLATRFSVGMQMTLPRFLVLLLATYYLAIRFEGGFANQYSIFVRLVIMIIALNKIMELFGLTQRRFKAIRN